MDLEAFSPEALAEGVEAAGLGRGAIRAGGRNAKPPPLLRTGCPDRSACFWVPGSVPGVC